LVWLIAFAVFVLITLLLIMWSMDKGRDAIDRNRVEDERESPDTPE
jgi:hypothetical protein